MQDFISIHWRWYLRRFQNLQGERLGADPEHYKDQQKPGVHRSAELLHPTLGGEWSVFLRTFLSSLISFYCGIIRFLGGSIFMEIVGTTHSWINILHELISYGFEAIFPSVGLRVYIKLYPHVAMNCIFLSNMSRDNLLINLYILKKKKSMVLYSGIEKLFFFYTLVVISDQHS